MWDSISHQVYGDVKFTDVLINANPEYRYIYIFSEGVVLNVPDVEDRITAWMRCRMAFSFCGSSPSSNAPMK